MKAEITGPPARRRPSLLLRCRAPAGGACSRPGGGGAPPPGGAVAVAGEGLVALALEGLFPGAEEGLADVEGASGLGHGVALLGDELDGLDLERAGVLASLS